MKNDTRLSTSRIAEQAGMEGRQLFRMLAELGWIVREENHWKLTPQGEKEGGSYQHSDKYGDFIVWPETILRHTALAGLGIGSPSDLSHGSPATTQAEPHLSATRMAESYHLTPRMINCLLAELGWIERNPQGWLITPRGRQLGGEQRHSKQGYYVVWPNTIGNQEEIAAAIANVIGEAGGPCLDGHLPRNAGERRIDNWLYLHHIPHASRHTLPGSELSCSFYLPVSRIYLDFWGFDNSSGSLSEKLARERYCQEQGLRHIELGDDDLKQLDEVLPRQLLQFGMQVH